MKQNKETLKQFFETGDKPTQQQYADLIDSYVDAQQPAGEANRRFVIDETGTVNIASEQQVPEYTLSPISGTNTVDLLKDGVSVSQIDLTPYLDNTNLARLVSGTVDANGLATFVREDNSTFTVDLSNLKDTVPQYQAGTNITIDNTDPQNPIVKTSDSFVNQVQSIETTLNNKLDVNGGGDQLTNVDAVTLNGKSDTDFLTTTGVQTVFGKKTFSVGQDFNGGLETRRITFQPSTTTSISSSNAGIELDVNNNFLFYTPFNISTNFAFNNNNLTAKRTYDLPDSDGEILLKNIADNTYLPIVGNTGGIDITAGDFVTINSQDKITLNGVAGVEFTSPANNIFTGNVIGNSSFFTKNMVVDPLGSKTNIAGSVFTVKKQSTETSTNVAEFISVDRQASATPGNTSTNSYALVAQIKNNSTVDDAGFTAANLTGSSYSTNNYNFLYGSLNTATAIGTGTGNFVASTVNRSKITGAAVVDYLRGSSSTTTVDNASATVNYMQGSHNSLVFTNGTVGDATVSYLDIDNGAATVTGDLAYIRAGNDPLPTVSGNAYFIKSESVLPSEFSGSLQTTQYKLSALNTAPSSSSDTGTEGEIRYTADYIYVCVAANTWKRTALSTW
ncbi:hypothetical protein P8625_10835 [Tenacibaculum tangerinum]|uniref:Uncharacterized protein n=1 Tax=Tenacibaculum tangerinum TaxID=3038772 RepID=A0ABY8KZX4_9FLAO|nr:hypothetical protein [Tenacibaculum tangerinum]WGH74584.1 hypothetical protein P8625_10835 [Tenacibaculum tangerinum]